MKGARMKINSLKILFGLVTLLASAASEAIAQNPVTVRFDPQNTTVTAGDSFTVKLVADIPAPVVGWGLDVGFDSALLSLESVEVGPAWHAATAADGDSLAGLVFPSPVSGQNTLLATLHLKAKVSSCTGTATLVASFTANDLAEGFPLPLGDFANATFVSGSVSVVGGTSIINPSVDKPVLWSPNHQMVDVTVSYETCSSSTNCQLSVASNEAVNGNGDGNTDPDWVIVDAHHVQLRAERSGNNSDRVYTITITCTSGNSTATRIVLVTVPHDQS
ncbi:MAG TPA: cohesin domain-containing protein [Pyrinomonadaceae bacterium]|nr:cohesin domain-containing protein [Pyrinomonadaceae bacterium]